MIKIEEIKKLVSSQEVVVSTKSIETYTCSDGRVFTNDQDSKGKEKGIELAENHERFLEKIERGKLELKFKLIENEDYNEGFYQEFLVYLNPELSEEAHEVLLVLIQDHSFSSKIKFSQFIRGCDPGVYRVYQDIEEQINTNCPDELICTKFYFEKLEVYYKSLLEKCKLYKSFLLEEDSFAPQKTSQRTFIEGHPVDYGNYSKDENGIYKPAEPL